jgi:hypothetical protein
MSSLFLTFASNINVSYIYLVILFFRNYLDVFFVMERQGSMFVISHPWITLRGELALEEATDLS